MFENTGLDRGFLVHISQIARALERQADLAELEYLETHDPIDDERPTAERISRIQKKLFPDLFK